MKFGEYLRQHREQFEWTQPEAATKIEIEQSYLSKLETGKSHPSEDIFDKLVKVYNWDMDDLYRKVASEDLEKLKQIKQVREAIIKNTTSKVTTARSWLISGLIMLMLAAGCFGGAISTERHQPQYTYRSEGVLQLDEELSAFDLIHAQVELTNKELATKRRELLTRIEQVDEVTTQFKGEGFVKSVENGRRFFVLINRGEVERNFNSRLFLIPTFMFFFGGICCFYVSRRWNTLN